MKVSQIMLVALLQAVACGAVTEVDADCVDHSDPSGGEGGECVGEAADALEGTRLKLRKFLNEDGSTSILPGWYDSVRKESCEFRVMVDGGRRCVPINDVAEANYFLDAACTQPFALVRPDECHTDRPVPKYITWTETTSCWLTLPIRMGTVFPDALTADQVYELKAGACVDGPWLGGKLGHVLAEELSPSEFVGSSAD